MNQKKKGHREKERKRVLYVKAVEKNNKKIEKKEYFIEISCKIDKLMGMFCKNDSVKQKKQVLSVKQTESYAQTDVIALNVLSKELWYRAIRGL